MTGLTALRVKNAKPGRHADGQGLYLLVRETGSRSWVLRTQMGGKRQDLGLGSAARLSLAQARTKASELRARIKSGENVRADEPAPQPSVPTFSDAARACHEAMKSGWANKRHRDSWLASLENHIFPAIGAKAVDQVTSVMVRDALVPIWLSIPETARRILQRIGTVLDYAHIEGWCHHEAALRSVTKGLPRQPTEEGHFVAMPYVDVPVLVMRLTDLPETAGRDALLFTLLNAVRSGETRLASWPEFDLKSGVWTIPAVRMKMKKEHVVPLSPAAVAILERRRRLRSDEEGLVFSTDGNRPLSDMTMTKVLRDLGHEKVTVHGFRSSFTDWAAEKTRTPKEVVDKALAHKLVDRVEAAYRRTDFFERRRRLMKAWADYISEK
ncbi:tyrosine-type recombinase/integrase [Sphingomonas sp. ERG5]|uniref:tyrosine-type recombinase/integrase n=1 Tax=Sphingomonas sp. ERG5 TaxID=1381597 RepID=UPI00054BCF83|nr:site-specific integrase [Sphingomonas sp. ERG5]